MITEVTDNLKSNHWRIKLILENKKTNKQTPLVLVFSSLQLHEFAPKDSFMYVIYPLRAGGLLNLQKKKKSFL